MIFPSKETVAAIRRMYPIGVRVELVKMNDPYTKLMPGSRGRIREIDDTGTIFVQWDNGEGLGIVYGEDSIRIIAEDA